MEIGLRGGVIGQPVVWQNGLSNPTRPDTPDWQQNYAIDFSQPLYQGGRIKYSVRKAGIEHESAMLQTANDRADIKTVTAGTVSRTVQPLQTMQSAEPQH